MLHVDLLDRSELPESEALDAIEVATARVLTSALRTNVSVRVIEQKLEITAYPVSDDPVQITLETINRKLQRHLLHQVELELQKRRTFIEAERLKALRGNSAPGEILRIAKDGALFISLEIADCYRRLIIAGVCPLRCQPRHEQGLYIIGNVKEFYITSVVPVMINSRSSRVRILLSRTSRELPRLLLQERSRLSGIQCLQRIPGGYCDIVTPKRIPKDVINSVGKELGEHLHVSILKTHH